MREAWYKAYMTVEACFIMPLVLMVYLFIVQYALWAYDRCMLEFDVASMLLRGAVVKETEVAWLYEKRVWDKEKYTRLHSQDVSGEKGLFSLKLTGKAEGSGMMEDVKIAYEMWNIEPAQWLRGKRKAEQSRNIQEGEEES